MGLNLCVYRFKDGKRAGEATHEQWDSFRYAGDRDFATEVLANREVTLCERDPGDECMWLYRPKDIEAWKRWDAAFPCNNGRWAALADLLASDPELWVYQSL